MKKQAKRAVVISIVIVTIIFLLSIYGIDRKLSSLRITVKDQSEKIRKQDSIIDEKTKLINTFRNINSSFEGTGYLDGSGNISSVSDKRIK